MGDPVNAKEFDSLPNATPQPISAKNVIADVAISKTPELMITGPSTADASVEHPLPPLHGHPVQSGNHPRSGEYPPPALEGPPPPGGYPGLPTERYPAPPTESYPTAPPPNGYGRGYPAPPPAPGYPPPPPGYIHIVPYGRNTTGYLASQHYNQEDGLDLAVWPLAICACCVNPVLGIIPVVLACKY